MEASISVSLDRVREIIDGFGEEFSTADVLRKYSGGFYSNIGTPPNYSFNALFGELLSKHSDYLGIVKEKKSDRIKDDLGNPTSCSIWSKASN